MNEDNGRVEERLIKRQKEEERKMNRGKDNEGRGRERNINK